MSHESLRGVSKALWDALQTKIEPRWLTDPVKRAEIISAIEWLRQSELPPKNIAEFLWAIDAYDKEHQTQVWSTLRTSFLADITHAFAKESKNVSEAYDREKSESPKLSPSEKSEILENLSGSLFSTNDARFRGEYEEKLKSLLDQASLTQYELRIVEWKISKALQWPKKNARGIETGGIWSLNAEELSVLRKIQPIIDLSQEVAQMEPMRNLMLEWMVQDLELSKSAEESIKERFWFDRIPDKAHFEEFKKFFDDALLIKNACDMASGLWDETNASEWWRKTAAQIMRDHWAPFQAMNLLKRQWTTPSSFDLELAKHWMDEKNSALKYEAIGNMLVDSIERMVPGVNIAKDGLLTPEGDINWQAIGADGMNVLTIIATIITMGTAEGALIAWKLAQMGVAWERVLFALKWLVQADRLVMAWGAIYGGTDAGIALMRGDYGQASIGIAMATMGVFGAVWSGKTLRNIKKIEDRKMEKKIIRAEQHARGVGRETVFKNADLSEADRILEAEKLMNRAMSAEQKGALMDIHENVSKGIYSNDAETLMTMARQLEKAGFSKEERDVLIRSWVLGKKTSAVKRMSDAEFDARIKKTKELVEIDGSSLYSNAERPVDPRRAKALFEEQLRTIREIFWNTPPDGITVFHREVDGEMRISKYYQRWLDTRLKNCETLTRYLESIAWDYRKMDTLYSPYAALTHAEDRARELANTMFWLANSTKSNTLLREQTPPECFQLILKMSQRLSVVSAKIKNIRNPV